MRTFDRRLVAGRHARRGLASVAACSVMHGTLVIVTAVLLASVIADAFTQHATLATLTPRLVLLGGAVAGRAGLTMIGEGAGRAVATRLISDLRRQTLRGVVNQGPSQLRGGKTGELVAVLTAGLDSLDGYFSRFIPLVAVAAVVPAAAVIYVLTVDWVSALILLLTLPLIPLFAAFIGRAAERSTRRRWTAFQVLNGHFLDVLQGLPTLRLFGRGAVQAENIRRISRTLRRATMATLRVAFVSAFALELLTSLGVALVAVTIAVRLVDGSVSLHAALVVLILAPDVYLPFRSLAGSFHGAMHGLEAARAAFALVPAPHPRANRNTVHSGGAAEIRFEDVTYAHGHGSPVLQGFTLTLAAGERVIIRAPSGGGKTTAMHLVLGLVTPQRGRVLAAGADAALTRLAVPASVAWLPQLPHLFAATVADNVRLGAPGATDDAVRDALRRVNADFVDELPFGVESLIGDRGTTLSGGQRQRIAVARTMLLDCPIVLLDEPLAHLGAESRAAIGEQLEAATRGRTVLIAAHAAEPFAWADGVIDIVDASGLRATPLQAAGVPA